METTWKNPNGKEGSVGELLGAPNDETLKERTLERNRERVIRTLVGGNYGLADALYDIIKRSESAEQAVLEAAAYVRSITKLENINEGVSKQ